jgi:hypothetical protein
MGSFYACGQGEVNTAKLHQATHQSALLCRCTPCGQRLSTYPALRALYGSRLAAAKTLKEAGMTQGVHRLDDAPPEAYQV